MIAQRAQIILAQSKKVIEEINTLISYMVLIENDLTHLKEEESVLQSKVEQYRQREEYYKGAEAQLKDIKELDASLKKERETLQMERGLIEKEKQVDRERKVQLDALSNKLQAQKQRLQNLIAAE